MTTYKSNLALFARRSGDATSMLMGKRQDRKIDGDGNSIPTGVRLGIVDRCKLLDLKETIDKILEDCADDGY